MRDLVGPDVPIAVTLDLHANIGQAMVDRVDVITTYDTYPHVDAAERAREAVDLLAHDPGRDPAGDGACQTAAAAGAAGHRHGRGPFKTSSTAPSPWSAPARRSSVTVAGGFAYADVPEAGVGFLVTTDDDLKQRGDWPTSWRRWRGRFGRHGRAEHAAAEAVAEAIAFPRGPVMLVDVGDNIGGGTPGDGTVLLAELLAQELKRRPW